MRQELDGPESKAYAALQAAKTPEEAAHAWDALYERSDGSTRGQRMASARALMDQFGGQGAADAPTGALTTAFAPTESKRSMPSPALSADETMGPGALNYAPPQEDKLNVIGRTLTNMGSSLAGISNPDQAKVLAAQAAAMQKVAGDTGTWSHVVTPNGQLLLMNSKDPRKTIQVPGNFAAPEKDPREQEAAKLEMKRAGDRYEQITTADRSSDEQLAKLDKFEQAVRSLPSTAFGPGADAITTAKALAAQAGFDVKGLTDAQIVQRMATQMQLDKGKMLPGAISNYEDQLMSRANGFGMDKQKDANLDAIASQRAILKHQKAAAQEAYKYRDKNAYKALDDGWEPYISDWNAKNGVQLPAAPVTAAPAAPATALSPGAYVWTPKGLQKK
jgi:hypothetical protein